MFERIAVAAAFLLAGCGFQLRNEPAAGLRTLYVSTTAPSQVAADIRRTLATGPTRVVSVPAEAEAHLRILAESRQKDVYTITGTGAVYDFQLRLVVRYELSIPGHEEPVIAPTEISARRVITYSASAPIAKEAEEQLLFKDMQADLARQILRHIAAVKREM